MIKHKKGCGCLGCAGKSKKKMKGSKEMNGAFGGGTPKVGDGGGTSDLFYH